MKLNKVSVFDRASNFNEDYNINNYVIETKVSEANEISTYLKSEKGDYVLIRYPESNSLLIHNTSLILDEKRKDFSRYMTEKNIPRAALYWPHSLWLSSRRNIKKENTVFEMGIENEVAYNLLGQVQKYDGKALNPKNSKLQMTVDCITGEIKENLLSHLDNRILKLNTMGKRLLITSLIITTIGFGYKKSVKPILQEARNAQNQK